MEWTTACPDWRDRIREGRSLVPCAPLFPEEAASALEQFKSLKIVDAPGMPTFGEAGRPWLFDLVSAIFGSYDHQGVVGDPGRRLIREFFLLISKKNAKSTGAAGIMQTALLRNWRQSAELLVLAPTIEVAGNAFQPARDMVAHDEELAEMLHVQGHLRTITHRTTNASLKVVAADSETVSGKKTASALIDELWLFGKRANAESMLREALGGLVSRPEGFVVWLSTQSDDPPAGIFRQKLQYARDVRDGKIVDPKFMPILYEYPEDMVEAKTYLLPDNLPLTNPNIGASVDKEWLVDELRKAQGAGESSLRVFLAKHLNVEIGMALRADRWVGANFWEESADASVTLEAILERCEVVVVGIDGGGLDDLLGLYVIGREKGDADMFRRRWLGWGRAWVASKALDLRKSEASRLLDLEASGDLVIVEKIGEDIDQLVEIVRRIEDAGLLPEKHAIGMDPAGVGSIVDALALAGIEGETRVVGVSQGWKMQGAFKTLERKMADGSFRHAKQDLLTWAVSNARTELKGSAMLITKAASGTAKIDPLMAAGDAAALMSMNPEASGSVYTVDRGLTIWG